MALAALAAAAAYWSPALWHLDETGYGDWRVFHHQWEAARVAIARYGEFPLWDPWHCGGVFLFGDPQAQVYSPFFLALAPFGTAVGLKLFLVFHAAAGFGGAFVFGRRELRLGIAGACLAALLWAGSGFFAWHLSGGHGAFAPFYLLPWLLLCFRHALTHWRASAWVAGLMVLTLLEGGVYPFALFVLLLGFEGLVALAPQPDSADLKQRAWRLIRVALLSGTLTLVAGAFRLLPILHTMRDYPRPTPGSDSLTLMELFSTFVDADHVYRWPGHTYVWGEYGTYIGGLAFAFAAVGLLLSLRRTPRGGPRLVYVFVGTVVFAGFTLGAGGAFFPWTLLHHLPVWSSLRVPSRFAVICSFYLALAAGLALERILGWLASRGGRLRRIASPMATVVLIAVATQLYVGNAPIIDRWRGAPLPEIDHQAAYEVVPQSQYQAWETFPATNRGNAGCYTGIEAYHAARGLWRGRTLARTAEGRVLSASITSSRLRAEVELTRTGEVRFNQTWASGWRSLGVGEVAPDAHGLLTLRHVPAGRHRLRLRYMPDDFVSACALGGLGLVGLFGVSFWPRRKRHSAGGT